ncbi:FAD-binding domain-containing protein, partial [Gemmatimonas sp.]|uniref:FAD-binding domain-containing protein n=1 Tax=Gemmatimonas sp. TaxID=1962908 RepID=UPI0033429124
RVHDHPPLAAAAAEGRVLAVYVHEPEMQRADDPDPRHAAVVHECLHELRDALSERGVPLLELHGTLPEVFDALREQLPIGAIYAHEECGNGSSYARDRRVRAWAKGRGVALHELPGNGVVRRLASRDGWHEQWLQHVRAPRICAPPHMVGATAHELSLVPQQFVAPHADVSRITTVPGMVDRQRGGRRNAEQLLGTFLKERGEHYRVAMSSPSHAIDACSRLSVHLTWGTLSVREAYQGARGRAAQLRAELNALGRTSHDKPQRESLTRWQQSLVSFASRLEWRDHFVQKLESEPALEYRAYASLFDNVWPSVPHAEHLDAWREGRTGYPLVDACMRSVHATGWLTFRMRAMVMSFASHYLWLHWRPAGLVLARAFTDYEPGIHWTQCQMQAGVTGINTIRIYNPIKQAAEHDAAGAFVRQWVPELAALSTADLLRPWDAPPLMQQMHGVHIGRDYPPPIVPHEASYAHARDTLHALKQSAQQQGVSRRVWQQHGSRRTPLNAPTR